MAKSRAVELSCVIVMSDVTAVPSTPASFLPDHCSPQPSGSLLGPLGNMGWRNWGLAGVHVSPFKIQGYFSVLC